MARRDPARRLEWPTTSASARRPWRRASTGSLLATPLERKRQVVGVIVVGRAPRRAAVLRRRLEPAGDLRRPGRRRHRERRLYDEVRAFNEELEAKVKLRTTELTAINAELGRAIAELRETQAQLILSERLAGLGLLVAGVAHEINSPSAAIRGSVDAMADNVQRLADGRAALGRAVDRRPSSARAVARAGARRSAPQLASRRMPTPAAVAAQAARAARRRSRRGRRRGRRGRGSRAAGSAATPTTRWPTPRAAAGRPETTPTGVAGRARRYLTEHVYLHRNALTIQNAIRRIQRIVGCAQELLAPRPAGGAVDGRPARRHRDHARHARPRAAWYHRRAQLRQPSTVPVYVDELNQVWTNLIQNAVQALDGRGHHRDRDRQRERTASLVRIIDDGPRHPTGRHAADLRAVLTRPSPRAKAPASGSGSCARSSTSTGAGDASAGDVLRGVAAAGRNVAFEVLASTCRWHAYAGDAVGGDGRASPGSTGAPEGARR